MSDLLSSCIRFYYVSTQKILSALRDNEYLKQSEIMISKVIEEFKQRAKPSSTLLLNINGQSEKKSHAETRRFYDKLKLNNEGRLRIEGMASKENK